MAPTRRSNSKSRFGCAQCKQRRVKCDEKAPCRNCIRRREECSLDTSNGAVETSNETSNEPVQIQSDEDWATEMHLMHHFTLYTSKSLSGTQSIRNVFCEEIPRLSRDQPILTSAIISMAALHMIEVDPTTDPRYSLIYRKHSTRVLSHLQKNTLQITEENCHNVLACASLVAFFTMKELAMNDLHLQNTSTPFGSRIAQSIKLVAGIKEIFVQAPIALASGPLGDLVVETWKPVPDSFRLSKNVTAALNDLNSAIMAAVDFSEEEREALKSALHLVEVMFLEASYLLTHFELEADQLMTFNALLPWTFTSLVEQGKDAAILTYSYYAILYSAIEGKWCMNKTFGESILRYARRTVRPAWQDLLEWPEEQCSNNLPALREFETEAGTGEGRARTLKEPFWTGKLEEDFPLESLDVD